MSASNIKYRDVSVGFQRFRDWLLGRKYVNPLRYEPDYSARTQPQPELPEGPAHKLSQNYYYLRDVRRKIDVPLTIAGPEEIKKLADPQNVDNKLTIGKVGVTPGKHYSPSAIQLKKL